jgi:hypothetical protein
MKEIIMTSRACRYIAFVTIFAAVSSVMAGASSKPAADEPQVVRLTLHPAVLPRPALKYLLLPGPLEQTPGNAESMIHMVAEIAEKAGADAETARLWDSINDWLDLPIDRLPRAEMDKALDRGRDALHYARLASRREWCEWDVPARSEGFAALLPSLAPIRTTCKLQALRTRTAIAEGRYDDALDDLKTGYALGRYVGNGITLIHNLVGSATVSLATRRVEEWVSSPDSPDLYWALTSLPRPIIDRRGLEWERAVVYFECPILQKIDTAPLSPAQVRELTDQVIKLRRVLASQSGGDKPDAEWETAQRKALADAAARNHKRARQELKSRGYKAEMVEAMPPEQVVVLVWFDGYRVIGDDLFKLFRLPFWEAQPLFADVEKRIGEERERVEAELGGGLFVELIPTPNLGRAYFLLIRPDRDIAMLRCVEAIRLYAHAHEGRLPTSLADIKELPLPLNPITGQPFVYEMKGDRATLVGDILPGMPRGAEIRYELQMAR